MTLNLSISSSYTNHVNYDLMHVGSVPSYKDVVGVGSTSDYRRVRAYLSPTGSPYMYDSGDIDGEIKPFKYYFSWNQGDYGHYSNIRIAEGTSDATGHKSNMILLYSADNNGLSAISPHWMMGYSLINSGELTFAGFPHAYSDSSGTPGYGSTTTKTPQGFGGFTAVKVWSPYLHMDPDRYNTMASAVGLGTTSLTVGNINIHAPWDGSFQTEVVETIRSTNDGNPFGLSNLGTALGNDTASAGAPTTTTEYPSIGSTNWSVGYTLPPTSGSYSGWDTDKSGNAGSETGYCIDYSDGFLITGSPGFDGNNGAVTSRKNRGGITVYTTHPSGRTTRRNKLKHTENKFFTYSRREGEQPGDRFGQAVAVGHNRFVVGAPGFNGGKGKAYLYTDAWRDHGLDQNMKQIQKMIQPYIF